MSVRMAEDVRELGIGAYVHDLGKVQLSDKAQKTNAPEPVMPLTRSIVRMLQRVRSFSVESSPSLVVYMVTHHHQRYDGKGFPGRAGTGRNRVNRERLAGDRIHIFARILSAVNVFDHFAGDSGRASPNNSGL